MNGKKCQLQEGVKLAESKDARDRRTPCNRVQFLGDELRNSSSVVATLHILKGHFWATELD